MALKCFYIVVECFATPLTDADKLILGSTEVKLLSWDISELKVSPLEKFAPTTDFD